MKIHKNITKFISVFLTAALLLGSLTATAFAAARTEHGMIDILASDSDAAFVAKHKDAMDAFREGAFDLDEQIDLYSYNLKTTEIRSLFVAARACYPELFFMNLGYSYGYTSKNGVYYVTYIAPTYTVSSKNELNVMLEKFYAKADEYLSLVDDSMNDFTKAIVLHDAIVLNSEYYVTKDGREGTPYTLMVEGWGKCEDYTRAYAYLLAQAGIKSEIIDSDSMGHEWMKINLGGKYYEVDVTWDDPVSYSDSLDSPGRITHRYFLFSDGAFQNHYGHSSVNPSNDTTFDEYTLHNMKSQFCMVNGALYCIYSASGSTNLVTYTAANEMTAVFDIGTAVTNEGGFWASHWSAGGGSYYPAGYANLGTHDGLFYYNMPKAVYVYDAASNANVKLADYSGANQLFGMKLTDGKVYGNDAESPNNSGTLKYVCDCLKMGDVDNDGVLNVVDATKIQKRLAELENFDAVNTIKADFDRDGIISINDATAIQREIAR